MKLPSYSEIIGLLKKGATIEAQEKILELREKAIEVQEENLELREKLLDLERQKSANDDLEFDGDVYWQKQGEEKTGPFCPTCHDTEQRNVRLHRDGNCWRCYACCFISGASDTVPAG